MRVFFKNYTHMLTRTRGKKFEDMFLIKIASNGTSLMERMAAAWSKAEMSGRNFLRFMKDFLRVHELFF